MYLIISNDYFHITIIKANCDGSIPQVRLYNNVLSRLGNGSNCAYWRGGGGGGGGGGWGEVMQKKQSPDFRFPEVSISGLCTTTIVQTLSLL